MDLPENISQKAGQYQSETEESTYAITIKETEKPHIEERYCLCSIKPIAELFAIAVRRHWNIEKKAVHNPGAGQTVRRVYY